MAVDISIFNRNWMINGNPINQGRRAQGRACNFRAIQAAIGEYGSTTSLWAYPDGAWTATRNNNEFLDAMDTYASYGLNMVTVGLMGGHPRFKCTTESIGGRNFVAFQSDGTLRADFKTRVENIITKADDIGMFVNVQYFYQNPAAGVLDNNAAYLAALDNATNWLKALPEQNIVVEVANEVSDNNYQEATVLQPANLPARIDRIHELWPQALVSVSMPASGSIPAGVKTRIDWVSFHANSLTTSEMRTKINGFCSDSSLAGKPITCTEDGPATTTDFYAAIDAGSGWGFYEQGCEFTGAYTPGNAARYRDGFQSLPVNWRVSNNSKRAFFEAVAASTGH